MVKNFCTQLVGGLGNQLFQYAFTRAVSIKKNISYSFDCSVLPIHNREYGLKYFNVNAHQSTRNNYVKYSEKYPNYYKEVFNEDFSNKYIIGYWQSEKYFIDCWDIISKELTFKNSSCNYINVDPNRSVFVHFRRTDYVNLPRYNFICDNIGYYERALSYIMTYVDNPILYIFSDDMEWVKNNFVNDYEKVYVSDIMKNHISDLEIMSECKYAITANSTFSWWGAYLGNDKIVAVPEKWYSDDYMSPDSLLPPSWKRIQI